MNCGNNKHLIAFNERNERKGLPPVSRRSFVKLAATSVGALALPLFSGCNKPSCTENCDSYYKRTLNDSRAIVEVDPSIELDDYSGPFIQDLRFSYFSRKQLAWMLIMAHTYHYEIQRSYRKYIYDTYGDSGVLNTEKYVWGNTIASDMQAYYSEALNITGTNIEAFMKQWQVDLNSLPGDYCDVIFEMPDETVE